MNGLWTDKEMSVEAIVDQVRRFRRLGFHGPISQQTMYEPVVQTWKIEKRHHPFGLMMFLVKMGTISIQYVKLFSVFMVSNQKNKSVFVVSTQNTIFGKFSFDPKKCRFNLSPHHGFAAPKRARWSPSPSPCAAPRNSSSPNRRRRGKTGGVVKPTVTETKGG